MANIFLTKRRYEWPDAQLNFWLFIMFFATGTMLGVYAGFMNVQIQLGLGIPWSVADHHTEQRYRHL